MKKLISILMITYNHEKYIEKAIESVLMQEGDFDFELLIGNDKSPDNTEKILEKYLDDKRIKIFNREKNLGANNNLWDLEMKAKGDYIAILEGDDFWITKDKLQKQLEILEKNKNIILCYTDSYKINENEKIIGEKKTDIQEIKNLNFLFLFSSGIPTGTVLFRNIFTNNGNIIKIKKLLLSSEIIGDLPLFALLIGNGKFYRIDQIMGAYRFITNNKTSTSFSSRESSYKYYEMYKVLKGIAEYYNFGRIKRFFLIKRIEDKLIKSLKKEKIEIENYSEEISLGKIIGNYIYMILKPIDKLNIKIKKYLIFSKIKKGNLSK